MAAEAGRKKVIVCGGGVIGVCSAYFLGEKGCDVTVIEQSSVACAASGKAGGFLALDWCSGPVDRLARLSFRLHEELGALFGDKYEFRRVNTLSVQVSQRTRAAAQKTTKTARGLPDWIDGPVTGVGEIGSTRTTAQVHPRLFTETMLREAQERFGVQLRKGTVQGVKSDSGKVVGVEVAGEDCAVPADAVVFALGPWTKMCKAISGNIQISGLKANSVVLRPVGHSTITNHMLFLRYQNKAGKLSEPEVYPRSSGVVYVCGMSSDGDPPRDPESILPDPEAPAYLREVAASVSSQLEDAELVAAQACYLPCSGDGLPVIGPLPGLDGAFVATGHSCWGILNAPGTGQVVAELVVGGRPTSVDVSAFDPKRFYKIPA